MSDKQRPSKTVIQTVMSPRPKILAHTCCKCCMFNSGWGAGSTGGLAAAEEVLLVDAEPSGVGPSFSLITASAFMMWYRIDSMESAMCGPYSLANFLPQSCWTAEKAFWKARQQGSVV